ncbi:MAG: hypothetical protein FWC95_01455 [Defluviitaleaceae bacterium]|nr:hypothetical protein [Defluviitaleaceae bacterium]
MKRFMLIAVLAAVLFLSACNRVTPVSIAVPGGGEAALYQAREGHIFHEDIDMLAQLVFQASIPGEAVFADITEIEFEANFNGTIVMTQGYVDYVTIQYEKWMESQFSFEVTGNALRVHSDEMPLRRVDGSGVFNGTFQTIGRNMYQTNWLHEYLADVRGVESYIHITIIIPAGFGGDVNISTINNSVCVVGYITNGAVNINVINGMVNADESSFGSFMAEVVNGGVFIRDTAATAINAEVVNGTVHVENADFTTLSIDIVNGNCRIILTESELANTSVTFTAVFGGMRLNGSPVGNASLQNYGVPHAVIVSAVTGNLDIETR